MNAPRRTVASTPQANLFADPLQSVRLYLLPAKP